MKKIGVLCASVAIVVAAIVARADAEPAAPDILHYDLVVVPDFDTGRIDLTATLDVANPDTAAAIEVLLTRHYDQVTVVVHGDTVDAARDGDAMTVPLSGATRESIRFTCSGSAWRSGDERRGVMSARDLFLLWSDRFYPNAFDDWATYRTEIRLPSAFDVIAPGRRTEHRELDDGDVIDVFETTHPTRNISIFADTRWVREERTVNGLAMTTLLHPKSAAFADRIFTTSADVVQFFTELHGDYPFDGFTFITIDSVYARRAFNGWVGYSAAYLARQMERTGRDVHETSLLWWGYVTGGAGPGGFQWTEGLGDYVEIMYDEARGLTIPADFERFRAEYLAMPDSEDVPVTALRGDTPQKIVHGKYPWLMGVMRFVVGDDAFRKGIRLLFERYKFHTFTLDDFVEAMEDGTGAPLEWWRDEWLMRPGVPELSLEWSSTPSGAGVRVDGRITQTGNVYHVPIEVGIDIGDAVRTERVNLTERVTTFSFDCARLPDRVVLDPNRWLLFRPGPGAD